MSTQGGGAAGNVGMYVGRDMLASVPEERREDYLRLVQEISDLKYQLGVEVARQLPRLFQDHDDEAIERYLDQVRVIAEVGWKSGVEVAKQLPDLYHAPDPAITEAYVAIVSEATVGPPDDKETQAYAAELEDLERELREIEPKQQRATELKSLLAARDRRDERRRKHAQELAAALPPILARLRPKHRDCYMHEVRLVAAADPEAALEAANTMLDLLNGERVSHDGAAEWVRRGLDVLEKNKEVGRGYFRMGSKYSLEVLEELREGLALRQVARVLKLYATALSGRDVAVRGTDEMDAVDRFGPEHIILPSDMRFFEDDDRNFVAYKVAAAHGAARIEFGTYRFTLDEIPDTVEDLTTKYGPGAA
ncbi:MAG: hypothetical protein FJW99_08415 [Actinobacteria bacterium]|nr:hypothetical protein [Actinomycetota bacterium]MBM3697666.1 hypothetical protein [Actinomycetota bacterium]